MTSRLIACASLFLVVSCGDNPEDPTPDTTVASVSVTGTANIAPGATSQLTASAKNAAGTTLTGHTATWASSANSVATVNSSGLVTGVANGTATITATISGIPGTRLVTVQAINPVAAATVEVGTASAFNPSQVDLSTGGTVTWNFNTSSALPHNVTFQTSSSGTPQNIPNQTVATVSRTFSTAGTFAYTCTNHPGMNGTVIVH